MNPRARRPVDSSRRARAGAAGPCPPRGPAAPHSETVNPAEKETPVLLSMTTSAPITPLNPAEHRVAQQLVDGLSTREIAVRSGLSIHTVREYVRVIRQSLHCPPRCKLQVLMHFVLASGQVTPPATERPAPVLNEAQGLLLRAVAEHSASGDVALAARIAPADVRSALGELLDKTGADDVTQLVVLAHAWGLLGTRPADTVESGAAR